MRSGSRILGALLVPLIALVFLWLANSRPGYFTNVTYLGGLMLLEVVIVAVWHYEKIFFLIMMLAFLWGGSSLPLVGAGEVGRWVFLIVGAAVGLFRWLDRDRRQPLGSLHLTAGLCVLSAVVSGVVSARTELSLLKTTSLFFLFLYGSCGARVAVAGREATFFRGLLTASEVVAYVCVFFYFVLRFAVLGNPNSLGAVMGVAVIPLLVWGTLVADERQIKHRRIVALCLATLLLVSSASRAGILACAFSVTVTCIALRRGTLLLKGLMVVVFLVAGLAVIQPDQFDSLVSTATETILFKGKPEQGLLGSRKDPWQDTVDVIKESPWFGSGFGTDRMQTRYQTDSMIRTLEGNSREHGSSYLGLLQYLGLLGIVPFVILLALVSLQAYRVCRWMWRSGSPYGYAVPLTMVCLAGLVHAAFEDWLFAVGYYLSVFFWTCVFLLFDLQPRPARQPVVVQRTWVTSQVHPSQVAVSAHR
ncbi:MAG TPA: O-antigen ligase family protein [Candidatus Sulfotelmatobacter sp.]|nr:O-antigen ligase family protein [Candidatus Sulfotelmatobacter sp.]